MDKFRIMIVDDDEDLRNIFRLSLGDKYEVVEACDGLDALEKLERAEPDFIVLDVMMPLMDGNEACRAIRNHPGFRDVPILFLSAKGDKEAKKEGYGAGANLYVAKPLDPADFVKHIEYFLDNTAARPRPKHYTTEQLARLEIGETVEPAPTAAAGARPAALPAEKPAKPIPCVMIVSGDRAVVDSASAVLSKDFFVTSAADAREAIERAIVHQPDIVVLDTLLPDDSAYQLCASLRRNYYYRTTPVLFLSARGAELNLERCRQLGANDFLPRPIDPGALRRKILECTQMPGFIVRPKRILVEIQFPSREE